MRDRSQGVPVREHWRLSDECGAGGFSLKHRDIKPAQQLSIFQRLDDEAGFAGLLRLAHGWVLV
jgi:hypothetical protein